MPVPDMQKRFRDFARCEFCGKSYQDDFFETVLFDNEKEGGEKERRIYEMCKNCREKCRTDRTFERYATEKAFSMKLGRKVKIKQ